MEGQYVFETYGPGEIEDAMNDIVERRANYTGEDDGEFFDELLKEYPSLETGAFDWKEEDQAEAWKGLFEQHGYWVVDDPVFEGSDSIAYIALPTEKASKPTDEDVEAAINYDPDDESQFDDDDVEGYDDEKAAAHDAEFEKNNKDSELNDESMEKMKQRKLEIDGFLGSGPDDPANFEEAGSPHGKGHLKDCAYHDGMSCDCGYSAGKKTEAVGLFVSGGSIGDRASSGPVLHKNGKHYKLDQRYDDPEEAKAAAKRRNAARSPGERGYYGIHYTVGPLKEGFEAEHGIENPNEGLDVSHPDHPANATEARTFDLDDYLDLVSDWEAREGMIDTEGMLDWLFELEGKDITEDFNGPWTREEVLEGVAKAVVPTFEADGGRTAKRLLKKLSQKPVSTDAVDAAVKYYFTLKGYYESKRSQGTKIREGFDGDAGSANPDAAFAGPMADGAIHDELTESLGSESFNNLMGAKGKLNTPKKKATDEEAEEEKKKADAKKAKKTESEYREPKSGSMESMEAAAAAAIKKSGDGAADNPAKASASDEAYFREAGMSQKQYDQQQMLVAEIKDELRKTIITPEEAYDALRDLGYGETRAEQLVDEWGKDKYVPRRVWNSPQNRDGSVITEDHPMEFTHVEGEADVTPKHREPWEAYNMWHDESEHISAEDWKAMDSGDRAIMESVIRRKLREIGDFNGGFGRVKEGRVEGSFEDPIDFLPEDGIPATNEDSYVDPDDLVYAVQENAVNILCAKYGLERDEVLDSIHDMFSPDDILEMGEDEESLTQYLVMSLKNYFGLD
jgi:hypothetical protein